MRKLSLTLLMSLGLMVAFFACDDDEPTEDPTPNISSVSPTSAAVGDAITISGTNFGSAPSVTVGGTSAPVSTSTETSITAEVPQVSAGDQDVVVTAGGQASNAVSITVEDGDGTEPTQNIVELAQATTGLETLVTAVTTAELAETLGGEGDFTVFAPTSDAFQATFDALGIGLDDLTPEVLASILLDHVVAGEVRASSISDGQQIETLGGSVLTATVADGTVTVGGGVVTTADVGATNGIVHVVDAVVGGEVSVNDDALTTEEYYWTPNNTYKVDGLTFVEDGGVLNIVRGTRVEFLTRENATNNATSALIIARGAQIFAEGSEAAPIVMTSEADNGTLSPRDFGQWGSLVVLGRANSYDEQFNDLQIEGLSTNETRAQYGGDIDDDNSGILRYVSIRYTGVALDGVSGNEIQGLTIGGIGSGTTIEYIDIYSSADDGVEIFGGTVNINHISVAYASDDAFDFDSGWRGTGQFLFALQRETPADSDYDHAGEWDGTNPDDAPLFAAPNLVNATFIGPGQDGSERQRAIIMRDGFAGKLANSLLVDFPGKFIQVEDRSGDVPDSYGRLTNPTDGFQTELLSNTLSAFGDWSSEGFVSVVESAVETDDNDNVTFTGAVDDVVSELDDNDNEYLQDIAVAGIGREPGAGSLDPTPTSGVSTAVSDLGDGRLETVGYRGAFAPGETPWIFGWTTLSAEGITVE